MPLSHFLLKETEGEIRFCDYCNFPLNTKSPSCLRIIIIMDATVSNSGIVLFNLLYTTQSFLLNFWIKIRPLSEVYFLVPGFEHIWFVVCSNTFFSLLTGQVVGLWTFHSSTWSFATNSNSELDRCDYLISTHCRRQHGVHCCMKLFSEAISPRG